jgi:hypothetical protein
MNIPQWQNLLSTVTLEGAIVTAVIGVMMVRRYPKQWWGTTVIMGALLIIVARALITAFTQ